MIRESVIVTINEKAKSQKKISRFNDGLEVIFSVVNYVNSLDEFATEIWPGHQIDSILIPNEFSDFVYPASIRYNVNDRRTRDLRIRPADVCCNVSYHEFINACEQFRGNFKKDAQSDMISFGSLRKHVSLNDVIDRITIGGRVNYYDKPFVPISIYDISSLFEDRYFNDDALAVLNDYIALMRFI